MQKIKHSKFRNTGMLFELLARQIAEDTLNKNNVSPAIKIVKEYFKKGSEINKELGLYNLCINQKYNSISKAKEFVNSVITERKKLSNNTLRKQKYNLIKEIKNHYPLEEFFHSRVSDYKLLASIYKLFEYNITTDVIDVNDELQSKETITEHITSNIITKKEFPKVLETYGNQEKDIRLLSYKLLVDKFNEKYKFLNKGQKDLLREYIMSVSNSDSLRNYITKQLPMIKENINKYSKYIDDKIIKIKLLNGVQEQLAKISKTKIINESQILQLLKFYELLKELKSFKK